MSRPLERSQSMTAYAHVFGEPDAETTSRMRKNLRKFVADNEASRVRRRHWAQAGITVAILAGIVGASIWMQRSAEPAVSAHTASDKGVVRTGEHGQRIELASGGAVEIGPHARVRMLVDDTDATSLELLQGTLTVDAPRSLRVQTGRYHVEADGAELELRQTRGVPLIDVRRGSARVHGPDLPDAGIQIRAPQE